MLQLQHSSFFNQNSSKEGKQLFFTIVALNKSLLFTTLQHLYVRPLVTCLGESGFSVQRIIRVFYFSKDTYVHTLTYSILA